MFRAAVIYWSNTGNTQKVAQKVAEGLKEGDASVDIIDVKKTVDIDFFDYDLICIGTPSYHWHPPKPMNDFLKTAFKKYQKEGKVKLGSPKIGGKNALIFCTYSGPHTGKNEAEPVGKYVGQFLEHIGFNLLDEWYILSEFHGSEENSTKGRMGDIRGLPDEKKLNEIRVKALELVKTLG
ncbi:flavodoxin domain-containing protein [Metallumcola ferriviriculae]|uniref:Flavodoxin domain-containing protein n=1 Tax=Metallumcola ferriviriculae TaxID=3039180 RepID=A0AAU0UL40_9FIRM|nr:flavodoxin domain-containing protein [Desulfitibacteraceae bacterium MK1]